MWDETPSAWQLRMAFPQEAKALEDILVAEFIQSLGLVSNKIASRKASSFQIKLEDNYESHPSTKAQMATQNGLHGMCHHTLTQMQIARH